MARSAKTPKYDDFNTRLNCFGRFQRHDMRLADVIASKKVMLEVGAGTAKVAASFAAENPDWAVLAIDHKSDRLVQGARKAEEQGLSNIYYIQSDFALLEDIVDLTGALDGLWITFPDPWPKDRHEKHRLTYQTKLDLYAKLLKPGGWLRFKTDNAELYEYSLSTISSHKHFAIDERTNDLHGSDIDDIPARTLTTYEEKFLTEGLPTHYLKAQRK